MVHQKRADSVWRTHRLLAADLERKYNCRQDWILCCNRQHKRLVRGLVVRVSVCGTHYDRVVGELCREWQDIMSWPLVALWTTQVAISACLLTSLMTCLLLSLRRRPLQPSTLPYSTHVIDGWCADEADHDASMHHWPAVMCNVVAAITCHLSGAFMLPRHSLPPSVMLSCTPAAIDSVRYLDDL